MNRNPKKWISRFIVFIGIVHISVGFILIGDVGLELLREGLFNTVPGQIAAKVYAGLT